jgi:PAS domain S-box-containing protein
MTLDLEKYNLALDSASNHVVITDEDGVVLYANKSAQKLTGYSNDEILGQTPRLWGGQMPKEFYTKFWHQIKQEKRVYSGIFNNKRKNGEKYLAEATVSPILDEAQKLVGFVGVEEDVTAERKILDENNANLQKLAKFNELMVGRELKMVEMKKVIADLKAKYEK